ncbi:class I SAM-dependent methyltransferase [Aquimarina sp. SS2-1]|uniref:class I SAM-dependent methyltransferase n=1 Tax=Aquimarina besae TaxID=3342247 RepID=UPI00366D4495
MELDLYNDTYDNFCNELIDENPKILEIGCGPGNIIKHIISKRPDSIIFGIDIAPNMIALAKKNNPSANFEIMDGREINTLNSSFDGIICGFYLPYLSKSDRFNLIKNCANLLNNNGVLYISFVAGNYKNSGYRTGSTGDQVYFYYHNLDDTKKELIEHHFSILYIIHKNYQRKDGSIEIHTIIIARRKA